MEEKFVLSTAYGVNGKEYKVEKETPKKTYIITDDYDNREFVKLSEDALKFLHWLNNHFDTCLNAEKFEEAKFPEF